MTVEHIHDYIPMHGTEGCEAPGFEVKSLLGFNPSQRFLQLFFEKLFVKTDFFQDFFAELQHVVSGLVIHGDSRYALNVKSRNPVHQKWTD